MARVYLGKETDCNPQYIWNLNDFKTWTRLNIKFTSRNKGPIWGQDTLQFIPFPS